MSGAANTKRKRIIAGEERQTSRPKMLGAKLADGGKGRNDFTVDRGVPLVIDTCRSKFMSPPVHARKHSAPSHCTLQAYLRALPQPALKALFFP